MSVSVALLSVTPVTLTSLLLTVTLHVAVLPPSSVVTVMVASPAFTAVTLPVASTVATAALLDFHVTFLLVAFSGRMVATRVSLPPTRRLVAVLLSFTPVTLTSLSLTVTLHVAVLPPSSVVTVMVASPAFTPVTLPAASTVAMAVSLDFQVTFWLVAFSGVMVAVRVSLSPTKMLVAVLLSFTPVTLTSLSLTVTLHVAVLPPSSVVTVMVASPAFTPMTLPLATVATASLLDFQVTFLLEASLGATVAVRVSDPPT